MKRFADRREIDSRIILTVIFSAVLFAVITVTMLLVACLIMALAQVGIVSFKNAGTTGGLFIILMTIAITSILVGTIVTILISKIPLDPINKVIQGMNRLASGHYDTRIDMGGLELTRGVSDSFNKLAEELENTEMLRSDFINNFSHEFKTPIVSILGFARLLKKGGMAETEQKEYLDIIETESERLSNMATNVLNLTKVENQTILTDVTEFNLSEQLRSCVILLEKKWDAKGLELRVDFDEYMIRGSMELLKQVWINLLDNAIKFSPVGGSISITIEKRERKVEVAVSNTGTAIPEENMGRIFDKFYQGDVSHSSEGSGVGLAIVKRIVQLHGGTVGVLSEKGVNTFRVELPEFLK